MSTFTGDSTVDLSFTWHWSKLSCWKPFYLAHYIFAYLILFTGFFSFISRLSPRLYKYHHWLGKFYIMFMLWGTATSLLIHNTGLPIGVLYSFLWCLTGLCVGWIAITIHMKMRGRGAGSRDEGNSRAKMIFNRMVSWKGFHGCIMFVSWINIAGRIPFAPYEDFTCHTYPVYKPVPGKHKDYNYTSGDPLKLVPAEDPDYKKLPWARMGEQNWAALMLLAPFFAAFIFGYIYLMVTLKEAKVEPDEENKPTNNNADANAKV